MIPLTTKSRSAIRIFWRSLETTHSVIASVPLEDGGRHRNGRATRIETPNIFFLPFAGNREIVKGRPNCSLDEAVGIPLRICAVLSKHHVNLLLLIPLRVQLPASGLYEMHSPSGTQHLGVEETGRRSSGEPVAVSARDTAKSGNS